MPLLELEIALERILAAIPVSIGEPLPISDACGRVIVKQARAAVDLPGFDNSAMDGFAVRAADVADANSESPVRLRLTGRVPAGEMPGVRISAGTCARVFTGSPLPEGADAVVMQEDTRIEPGRAEEVLILDGAKPWENVRLRGEDVKRGELLADAGTLVGPAQISLFAAAGLSSIVAGRQPTVALLATGSELREPGAALAPGQIYESNRAGLAPLIARAGGVPKPLALVPDSPESTSAALHAALTEGDMVVSTGGVSVGELDFVKSAFEAVGGTLEFWQVAIKPGKPFVFGRHSGKLFFGLPGNPVSAFVTFLTMVRPALLRWQGARDVNLPRHHGRLQEALANREGRRHFVRVTVDGEGNVRPAGPQASHRLGSLATANGLVDVPPQTTLPAGATVTVLRWD